MSTLKPFRVDYYIGFGKPKQTIVVQATSASVAGDIFKAMMPNASGGKKIRQIRRFAGSDKKGGRICRENA
jgi:hypothetical protein